MSSQPLPAQPKQLFHYLFEQASLGIALEDLEGKLLLANPALGSMLGYSENELLAMSCSQFASPEDSADDWALFQQLRAGVIDKYSLEKRYVRKDGTRFWGHLNVSLLKNSGKGSSPLVFAFVEDITERKRAEIALSESEQRFRLAVQAGRMYAFDWDLVTDVIVRSRESVHILNWTNPERDTGREFHARVHPDDLALYAAAKDKLTPENPTYQISFRMSRPDGAVTWLEDTGRASFDAQGKMVRVVGIVADITERKRTEKALRESEDRIRLAIEASKSVGWEWDLTSGQNSWFGNLRTMFGISADTVVGRTDDFFRYIYPEDRQMVAKGIADARQSRNPYVAEFRVLRLDGSTRWVAATGKFHYATNGDPARMLGMAVDITEQMQAHSALRESEDKLRLLLDSTAEAIYGVDLKHRCTFCNPACLRTLGYEHMDDVLGKHMHDLIHHHHADGTLIPVGECRIHQVLRTGEGVHAEDEVLWRANGTSFPAEYWSYPQHRGHEVVGAVIAFIDITERKLAEGALANVSRRLIEAQEQERTRIGRELHDDIGQRLALVAVELRRLRDDSVALPAVRRRMGKLQKQISAIALDVQSLSHQLHSAKLQYLGIASAMRGFCHEFGEQQRVEIEFNAHDLPTPLSADISLCLFRVLQEALHNSAKHSGVRQFEVRLWGVADEVHLMIKDSGEGFDLETARTSRGLGLISMEERLRLLNGTLSINSQTKRGTTIHARVPLGSSSESMRAAG